MKRLISILILVFALIAINLLPVSYTSNTNLLPTSEVSNTDCKLCNLTFDFLENYQEGQQRIIILCLNTWHMNDTLVMEYNCNGQLKEKQGATRLTHNSNSEGKCQWNFITNPDRHYCCASLYYQSRSVSFNLQKLSTEVCPNCLENLMNIFHYTELTNSQTSRTHFCDILMDTSSRKVYPISPDIKGYYIDDFWIHIDYESKFIKNTVYIIYNPSIQ